MEQVTRGFQGQDLLQLHHAACACTLHNSTESSSPGPFCRHSWSANLLPGLVCSTVTGGHTISHVGSPSSTPHVNSRLCQHTFTSHMQVREGLYYNPYFPGGAIAMPRMLADGGVEYDDGTPSNSSQQAKVRCRWPCSVLNSCRSMPRHCWSGANACISCLPRCIRQLQLCSAGLVAAAIKPLIDQGCSLNHVSISVTSTCALLYPLPLSPQNTGRDHLPGLGCQP